jgi:hypothetical protein
MVLPFSILAAGSTWSVGCDPEDSLADVLEEFDVFVVLAVLPVFDVADVLPLLVAVLVVVLVDVLSAVEPQPETRSAARSAISGVGDFILSGPS